MSATIPTTAVAPPRLSRALFQFRQRSVRERADFWLFVAGLMVEYVLLFALFAPHTGSGEIAFANYIMMGLLFPALAVHQFLIFRNSTLQYTLPGSRLDLLELLICLFFGVLTGELGYLLVLSICSVPQWLVTVPVGFGWAGAVVIVIGIAAAQVMFTKRQAGYRRVSTRMWLVTIAVLSGIGMFAVLFDRSDLAIRDSGQGLDWVFAEKPLVVQVASTNGTADGSELALKAIRWFADALGRALKAVFACGALALSLSILLWDGMVWKSFPQSAATAATESDRAVQLRSYRKTMHSFFVMDGLAAFTWLMVLGVVVPGRLQTTCFHLLLLVSLVYAAAAWSRLNRGKETVEGLSSEAVAATTVI